MPFTGKEESSARTALFLGGQEDVGRERAGENAAGKKQVGGEDMEEKYSGRDGAQKKHTEKERAERIPAGRKNMEEGEKMSPVVREACTEELSEILELYLFLHEKEIPENNDRLKMTWKQIMEDENHHLIVCEVDGKIVSSCVCVIIPNLTRNVRPYAFVENVVTHEDYRGKGYAAECLHYAEEIARTANCYKMMLLTGSKQESTLNFYRNAGYNSEDKTAFIKWLEL